MTKGPNPYTGDLGTPIKPADVTLSLLDDPTEREAKVAAEHQRITAELERRYTLLMDHYGVPADRGLESMALLAIELARTHVPGCRVDSRPARGRPQRWSVDAKFELVADFLDVMAKGKTRADAAVALSKTERYAEFKDKAESLAKRFDDARSEPAVQAAASLLGDLPSSYFSEFAKATTSK